MKITLLLYSLNHDKLALLSKLVYLNLTINYIAKTNKLTYKI